MKIRFLINCETDSWELEIPDNSSLPLKGDYIKHNGDIFKIIQRTWMEIPNYVDIEILVNRP